MQFILIILYVFTKCVPTISDLFRVELYCFVPVSTYCVFYYLLGYYLSGRDLKSSVKWMLLVGGSLGFAAMLLLKLRGANVSVGRVKFICSDIFGRPF